MTRAFSVPIRYGSMALLVAVLSSASAARADDALPSQEQGLAQALVNHPDIVAAKAKVTLAEAELYGKRMEVSRQILGLYGGLNTRRAKIDVAKATLDKTRTVLDKAKQAQTAGVADHATLDNAVAEVQTAEAALVVVMGEREQAEKELRLLVGPPVGTGTLSLSHTSNGEAQATPASAPRQTPQGPIVDKMKAAGAKPIKLEFDETPLQVILQVVADEAGVKFSIQRPALELSSIAVDMPISLNTGEVRLLDALQAFEDAYPTLQFVLRDYGVLLTTKDYAQDQGYVPVLELVKESAKTLK